MMLRAAIFFQKTHCLALVLSCALAGCETAQKREHQVFTSDDTAVEVGREVEILYSDSAIVRVRVTAPVLHNHTERENPRQEFVEGLKVEFFGPTQRVRSTLTAKQASRFNEKGLIVARDSVVLTTDQQERLETEELTWDERKELVYTEKFVKITKPGEVIYGFGLEANQDFTYWKIKVPKGRIKAGQLDDALE